MIAHGLEGQSLHDHNVSLGGHLCIHMGRTPFPLWMPAYGRHDTHRSLEMAIAQLPTGPKAEIWLILGLIYLNCTISNLYH